MFSQATQKFDRFQTLRINSQQPLAAQAQYVSLIINTCGVILCNP